MVKPLSTPVSTDKQSEAKADNGDVSLDDFPAYFTDFAGSEAELALQDNRLQEAVSRFDDIAKTTSDTIVTPRARFMAAYAADLLGDSARVLEDMPALAEELPLVADLAFERAAKAALDLEKYDEAIALADRVDEASTLMPDAAMTRADALRAKGEIRGAVAAYQFYLDQWPSSRRRQEAESRIVECLVCLLGKAELGEAEAKSALDLIEGLRAQSPSGYWTERAGSYEDRILAVLGTEKPKAQPARRAAQRAYDEAADLRRRMQNERAEKAYEQVIRLSRKGGILRCKARFEQAIVVANQRDYDRAAGLFAGVANDCTDASLRIRSLYRGGKAYFSADRFEDAVEMFGRVESEFPTHSFADDARLRAAKCYKSMGNTEKFAELLASLPDLYPTGDMRAEALWTLAHDDIARGALADAREVLAKYYALFPNERGWYAAGRSGYWLGRIEELTGDVENAAFHYEHVIAGAPLSCYMVIAYNRLAALRPERAKALIATLAPKGGSGSVRFSRSLLSDFRHLAVGMELQRLGLVDHARREFRHLLKTPDLPPEINWIVAALQRQAGEYNEARETTSRGDASWQLRYPADRDLAPWTLAYPTAYEEHVLSAAQNSAVSPNLIWAVMREESGFDPRIESWANALGLMQLILPTARSIGRELGIKVNRKTLRKPEVNIPLGAAYLSHLENLFDGHPVLTIAGYNAGEGAVSRWLKEIASRDVDVFIEQIPYEQTRGYTKRVLSTYATYLFLYGDEHQILELPLTLPSLGG
jgi:soluble lytic murein transglycosylase